MNNSLIQINHLTKNYGKHRGVNDITFSVDQGEILGFLNYEQGDIHVCGQEATHDHEKILKIVGYMPPEAWFYREMIVKEILELSAQVRHLNCDEERKILCQKLELDEKRKINELSLGNRKKVSIINAMQHKPQVFIFDEPTSGLDPLMQATFFELLTE